jgi:hypothetical protein
VRPVEGKALGDIGFLGDGDRDLCPVIIVDDDAGPGVKADLLDLAGVQPPIERHEQCAKSHAGELHLEHARVVLADQRHPIAGSDPQIVQRGGDTGDPVFQLCPGCLPPVLCASEGKGISAMLRVVGHPVSCVKHELALRSSGSPNVV